MATPFLHQSFLEAKNDLGIVKRRQQVNPSQMGEGRVSLTICADFYRPVEELEYTDLLRITFTQSDHERGFKTWRTPATHPQSAFCGKKYRWGKGEVECHMDPTITKASTGKERFVAACAESQSTSRGPNRTRFLAVQAAIRAKMQCDKK